MTKRGYDLAAKFGFGGGGIDKRDSHSDALCRNKY